MAFEELIPLAEAAAQAPHGHFRELCRAVFGTREGVELMSLLCAMEHPLNQTFCEDGRAASHLAGRREVVATLWRYGASTELLPQGGLKTEAAEAEPA